MSTHYSKVLSSGQRVEIDDINVTVDDSRYPTRNISAVHLTKANKPNIFIMIITVFLLVQGVLWLIGGITFPIWGKGDGSIAPVFITAFIMLGIGWKLYSGLKSPCHTISFGSSGNDKDLIIMPALPNAGLIQLLQASFKWEEATKNSYNEIKACSNAISDAIDELQRKGS